MECEKHNIGALQVWGPASNSGLGRRPSGDVAAWRGADGHWARGDGYSLLPAQSRLPRVMLREASVALGGGTDGTAMPTGAFEGACWVMRSKGLDGFIELPARLSDCAVGNSFAFCPQRRPNAGS